MCHDSPIYAITTHARCQDRGCGKTSPCLFQRVSALRLAFPTLVRSYRLTNRSVGSGPWRLLYCVVSAAFFSFLMLCIARTMTLASGSILYCRSWKEEGREGDRGAFGGGGWLECREGSALHLDRIYCNIGIKCT